MGAGGVHEKNVQREGNAWKTQHTEEEESRTPATQNTTGTGYETKPLSLKRKWDFYEIKND